MSLLPTFPKFVIFAIESPLRFTAQGTHTFSCERPRRCVCFPRLCALRGITNEVDFLWLPLKEIAKKVSSASTIPSNFTSEAMFCKASKILCRQIKAVSLLMPQISADLRTDNPNIIHSMYFFQVANDFLEENVIVLFLEVKVLWQSLHIKRCIKPLWPFFLMFKDLQCGQEIPFSDFLDKRKSSNPL